MAVRFFRRLPLGAQLVGLLALAVVSGVVATAKLVEASITAAELRVARCRAESVLAYAEYIDKKGGIYVRRESGDDIESVGRYSGRVAAVKEMPDGTRKEYQFHAKTAALAIEDLTGQLFASKSEVKMWLVPRPSYPGGPADAFDVEALRAVTQGGAAEFWRVENGSLRYAIGFVEEPGTAPKSIVSVSVPHWSFATQLASLGLAAWSAVAAAGVAFAALVWWLVAAVVAPVLKLSAFASRIAVASDASSVQPTQFDVAELSSRNEVHVLSARLKAIYESLLSAIRLIDDARGRSRVMFLNTRNSELTEPGEL